MYLILALLLAVHTPHAVSKICAANRERRNFKAGDMCNVYIGENKIPVFVLFVHSFVEVWVTGKVIRFSKSQIYA